MTIITSKTRKKNKRNRDPKGRKNEELEGGWGAVIGEVFDDEFEGERASFAKTSYFGVVGGVGDGDVLFVGSEDELGERHCYLLLLLVIGSSGWKTIEEF